MTVLDHRPLVDWTAEWERPARHPYRAAVRVRPQRPAPARPVVAPLRYRGTGVAVSRAVHTRRPVSTVATLALAALAAGITVWLGSIAHLSSDRSSVPVSIPDQLAVVEVQAGETLQQLAARVAPDAPAGQIVERIRDLNKLDSVAVDAGQTLIAPMA